MNSQPKMAADTAVLLGRDFGWREASSPSSDILVRFKGYLSGCSGPVAAADHIRRLIEQSDVADIPRMLATLDGHFAMVADMPAQCIVAVDRVRSIPLLLARDASGAWVIADHGSPLLERLGLTTADVDPDAARDFAMAGYVVGKGTLYRGIRALLPGECAIIDKRSGEVTIRRYALYRPWLVTDGVDRDTWVSRLRDVTLHILEKMVTDAAGRQILLPLSAGLDSRLIASGLRKLGYRNVVCFSYGRVGNHEADAARKIAEKLGYPWHFLPTTTAGFRRARASTEYQRFLTLADNLVSTPVEQDAYCLETLRRQSWAADDGIIVNGQSGDYISGAHIPPALRKPLDGISRNERDELIFSCMVHKHFGLWPDLVTAENLQPLKAKLWDELAEAGAPLDDPSQAFALYEFSEFQNRQCKYVIGNQRGYEAFGYDWRLPLWDPAYLDFWERVPLEYKAEQNLYRDMLVAENWGGVWTSLLPAPRWIVPRWVVPLRATVKLACAPAGRATWHRVEKRLFNHITDPLRKYAAVPWWKVATTSRPSRNVVSWLTEQYLARHGLNWAGNPL